MIIKYDKDERTFVRMRPKAKDQFKIVAAQLGFPTMLDYLSALAEIPAGKLKVLIKK